jgi:intracellular septation protein A
MHSKVIHYLKKQKVHKSPFYSAIFLNFSGTMGLMVINSMYQKQQNPY